MKKRVLSLILAAVLVCALAVPAMAAGKTVVETIPCSCDVIAPIGGDFVRLVNGGDEKGEGGKLGYADKTGKLITPLQYYAFSDWDDYGYFFNGFEPVYQVKNGKIFCGVIDATGKEVIPCTMETEGYVPYFDEGFAPWYQNGKYAFIDLTGKVITPYKYSQANYAVEGLAAVCVGEYPDAKWGFVDKTGKEIVPCKYDRAVNFSDGLAAVERNGKWGFIDKTGKEVIACKYGQVLTTQVLYGDQGSYIEKTFFEGLAAVSLNGKWGFIDKTGKEVVPCKYDWGVHSFSEGLAAVKLNDRWGFVDKTGREVVPCKYDKIGDFSEGLAAVAVDSGEKEPWGEAILTWGYVDKTGKEVIPCEYAYAGEFHDGLAAARKKGEKHAYYIDKTGKVAIGESFDGMNDFCDGFAFVRKGDKWGVIDKTGKVVLDYLYDEPADSREISGWYESPRFYNGMARVWKDGKYGLVSIVDSSRAAFASTQTVTVDGKKVEFQCYALKDAAGNDTNYIKLRDLADILNGSAAQFEVGWDGQVTVTTGQGYTKNGSEQKTPFSGNRMYKEVTAQTMVNGKAADLAAFALTDDAGGGYTYYKLRDLGTALGFKVDWTAQRGIFIETK